MLKSLLDSKTKKMGLVMIIAGGLDIAANIVLSFHFLPELGVAMTGTELIMAGLTTLFMRMGIDKAVS